MLFLFFLKNPYDCLYYDVCTKYKSNDSDTNLTCPQFTKILNILGVVDINTPDYNAKMNDIKSLSLEDKAYLDVINNRYKL